LTIFGIFHIEKGYKIIKGENEEMCVCVYGGGQGGCNVKSLLVDVYC